MIKKFGSDITLNVIASVVASVIFLIAGFFWGKYQEHQKFGKNLDQYDFYPFEVNRENIPEFKLTDFRLGMHYFLKNDDYTAARQLMRENSSAPPFRFIVRNLGWSVPFASTSMSITSLTT